MSSFSEEIYKKESEISSGLSESYLELLEKIETLTGLGFWIINLETQENYWSKKFLSICEMDLMETKSPVDLGLSVFHREDRGFTKLVLERAIKNETPFQIQTRIKNSSGEVKHVIFEGRIERNEASSSNLLLMSCKNLTNFKNNWEARDDEQDVKAILEYSLDLIFLFDRKGVISNVSTSVVETLGYPMEEIIGKRPIDFVYPSDLEITINVLDDIRGGKRVKNFKNRYLDAKGNLVYLEWTGSLKEGTGNIIGVARDITELVELKKTQKQDKLRVQSILHSSPDLIWSLDSDFKLLEANKAFSKLMKDTIGWEIKPGDYLLSEKVYDKENLKFWEHHYKEAFKGKKIHFESKVESKGDVLPIFFETKITPILSKGEVLGLACFSRDVSEKRKNEKRIIELNQKLLIGQELSKIGYWESDLKSDFIFWSDEMYKIWEVDKSKIKIDFDFFFNSIHPEDRKDFLYHRNRSVAKEKNLDIVYRIITEKENIKFIHELGEIIQDEEEKYIFRGTAQEITKEKEIELKLKERNLFIESTLGNIPLGIAVNNISDGETTYINKAFQEIYGWPKEDLLDVNSFFEKVYPNPEYRSWIKDQIIGDIQSGDPEHITWNRILINTKDGKEKIVNAKNIPLPDLNLMISTVTDDTERYWAEQELKVSNDRFKLVSEAVSDAIWDWDLIKNSISWGSGFHRLFGYPQEQNQLDGATWSQFIHSEDYEEIAKSLLKAKSSKSEKYWSGEYRFKKIDGTYAYVKEKSIIIRDKKGKAIRIVGALQDTTKDKERENHLKLLESVVTNTKDSVLITKAEPSEDGYQIIYCNNAFAEMTGYPIDEIVGKDPKIFQGKDSDQNILKQLGKNLRQWKSSTVEVINYKKDGTPFWVNMSIAPIADPSGRYTHWIAIERDFTEKKKSEQELLLMNERFRLISDATNDAIYDWDIIKGHWFIGEGFSKLFGINNRASSKFGEEWANKIHPEDFKRVESIFSNQLLIKGTQSEYSFEYRVEKADGSYIYVLDSGKILRSVEGDPLRMIGAVQDINDRKEYESSLRQLNDDLEKSNRQLENSNQELEQFAFVASHDLQEPLRMITSFLGLIEKRYNDVLDEKGRRYIHFAVDGANRMQHIILDLLEFSKLDNFQEAKSWMDSVELVEKSKLFISSDLRKKSPIFHIDQLPQIYGYKNTLVQLFQNIISNAIKYQPSGQTAEIWISSKENEDFWEFAIRDNGIGVEKDYLEKIFVIFQRLHSTEEYKGTGIGLAISKKIVDLHDGKIWIESQLGHGSKFFFTIKKPKKL